MRCESSGAGIEAADGYRNGAAMAVGDAGLGGAAPAPLTTRQVRIAG